MRRTTRALTLAALTAALTASLLPVAHSQEADPQSPTIRAGYGDADNTWHVGAGAGQYSDKSADSVQGLADQSEIDPHNHSTTQKNSYGVQSRLSFRAIVVEDAEGDHVAFVKSDNYLAMDALQRRVGQILDARGSAVTYDEIMHMASHNHYSPMYSTPSWGVWAFQDVMDIRAFEYQARQMAAAILEAEANLVPARMGATEVEHYFFKGMVARRTTADDNTPVGYPLDFGDFGLPVIRFDDISDPADPKPIATLINWGMHPEGLEADDLITAEFLAPLERFVERATGAPLVFGQGDVGSSESGPARPYHPDWPKGVFRQWDNAGHAQVERGGFLLAQDVIDAWNRIGEGDALVPFDSSFDVAAGNAWVPGPLSHPYPSYGNCRTEAAAEGSPRSPTLPTCAGPAPYDKSNMMWDSLRAHGIPLPEHYSPPAFTGVEENLRLHLQAFKLGEVILMSCACEAQVDLILNLESRTNETQDDMWLGYDWTKRLECTQNADTTWTCRRRENDTPDGASHPTAPGSTFLKPLTFSDAAMKRMKAQIYNDAAGWNEPQYVPYAESDPADPAEIKGNFTHDELSASDGYKLPVGVGHGSDYNGYTVSYREYMAYDHYRKALQSYGPHTADYMNTILVDLARELNDPAGDHTYDLPPEDLARAQADEARQVAFTTALGQKSSALYDAWRASLPDDVGPAAVVTQPRDIRRFDSTIFEWRGGSNAVDNPVVAVQRRDPITGEWVGFADQSGEIQTKLEFPRGVNGFAETYAGDEEWIWTASFEAFNAFPAEIGSTPAGLYRFVVDGEIRRGGADEDYHLESEPFLVRGWDGLKVEDMRLEGDGSVSFVVPDPTYPEIDHDAAFPYVRMHMRSERGTNDEIMPGDQKSWCDTCSFRPWATSSEVVRATVTVERVTGLIERITATKRADGRWYAPTDLRVRDVAYVRAGDAVDAYGETNAEPSAEVTGARPPRGKPRPRTEPPR